MNGWIVTAATVALIVLSAFFVIIEFALLGARRYRLEAEASESASARAALRGVNELTIMLAGAQLGITVCTFALGAITKPAVDAWLGPVLAGWGLPAWLADGSAFALSLLFVTFLHLVIGEMAPKSWAIAHPETAAKLIGVPSRAFVWPLRPFLVGINRIANRLVRRVGVEPVDSAGAGGHDAKSLRQLVEHSSEVGALEPEVTTHLTAAMDALGLTVGDIMQPDASPTSVGAGARVADVWAAAGESGHLRILVLDASGEVSGVVHVRDTLLDEPEASIEPHVRRVFEVDVARSVPELLADMRERNVQLAVVRREGRLEGVVTIADIVERVLPGGRGPVAVSA